MVTIEQARKGQRIPQAELAARIGLSRSALSRLENGHRVQRSTFLLVCQALGISPDAVEGVKLYSGADQAARRKQA